jgi:hypothetical protein
MITLNMALQFRHHQARALYAHKSLALMFLWCSGFQYFRHIHKVTKSNYCLHSACLSVHPSIQTSVCMEQLVSHWKYFGQILY